MNIDLSQLDFTFSKKPLVIGGKAMEYYGLRQSGNDTDLVVAKDDLTRLIKKYPKNVKNIAGDLGVAVVGFEIWKTINYFDYDFLSQGAIEEETHLICSLEKLAFIFAMVMHIPKYHHDLELVVKKIIENQTKLAGKIRQENDILIND